MGIVCVQPLCVCVCVCVCERGPNGSAMIYVHLSANPKPTDVYSCIHLLPAVWWLQRFKRVMETFFNIVDVGVTRGFNP